MEIYLHNTLSKDTEHFRPLEKGKVKMYNCGPTVYSKAQIGNLRAYIFADTLRRMFEYNNFEVDQIINITDVGHLVDDSDEGEDKMEKGAREQNKSAKEIADEYTSYFLDSLKKLNVEIDNIRFPKATDHIPEQISMVETLEKKGFTYKTTDGIYFDTSKFKSYGKLGDINIEGLREGARIEANSEKRNATDFALWKFSDEKEKRQQEWDSPWGIGFPGWHIECSAMSKKYLGEEFDIHTGGIDHISIHHNNEIAQSESANGKIQARYWLHNNFLLINNEKMSKSIGNVIYLEDLENKDISPSMFRYWVLTAHYRTLINFTYDAVNATKTAFNRLLDILHEIKESGEVNNEYKNIFNEYINDDLNTPRALGLIWDLLKDRNITDGDKLATILDFDKVLGLNIKGLLDEIKEIPEDVIEIVKEREYARSTKNFVESDRLRNKINSLGFDVKDTENGTVIKPL